MRFFLGTHRPYWLKDPRFENVPLFLSRRQLDRYSPPYAITDFALDSGGFTELQMHGRWTLSAEEYAASVLRYAKLYGKRMQWAAPQDWMCEPIVLAGGPAARGIVFAGTKLTVEEHQKKTVANFVHLRRLLGGLVIPVLQGWQVSDYLRCCEMYADAGVRLSDEATVGVGSVCRRQSSEEAASIIKTLAAESLRLHGFGFKKGGLKNCLNELVSADSTSWSEGARRRGGLPGHDRPGPGRPKGHKNCANCAEWALAWRADLIKSLEERCAA